MCSLFKVLISAVPLVIVACAGGDSDGEMGVGESVGVGGTGVSGGPGECVDTRDPDGRAGGTDGAGIPCERERPTYKDRKPGSKPPTVNGASGRFL